MHPLAQPCVHALWDGGLFAVGLGLVRWLCPPPPLRRSSWRAVSVLVAGGPLRELGAELAATTANAWSRIPADALPGPTRSGAP